MTEDLVGPNLEAPIGDPAPEMVTPSLEAPPAAAEFSGEEPKELVAAPRTAPADARRYTSQFALAYAALGIVLIAAITGLIVLVIRPGHHSPPPWSTWKPASGTVAKMMGEITDHVAKEYKLNSSGTQLVALVPTPPQVTSGTKDVKVSTIAIRQAPQSNNGIRIISAKTSYQVQLCGLGSNCSIASGAATELRGRLVRREALEVALYTFKYVPSVTSLSAFMPPPPGETSSTLLFLEKDNLKQQLSDPLLKTLPLATPPLPTAADAAEAATIDKLTLKTVFTYQLTELQDGSAALILDPATA
ncbi:MAG: hypothetical protein WCH31_04230 [Actinomycetes bacterium]